MTNLLALKLNTASSHRSAYRLFILERSKCKPLRSASLLIEHNSGIHHLTKLTEERFEGFTCDGRSETANKDFGGTLMLGAGDGAFGIDLYAPLVDIQVSWKEVLTCLPSR